MVGIKDLSTIVSKPTLKWLGKHLCILSKLYVIYILRKREREHKCKNY